MENGRRFHISWKEQGQRRSMVSPHVKTKGAALGWLLGLKPYIARSIETVKIKVWQRTDSK